MAKKAKVMKAEKATTKGRDDMISFSIRVPRWLIEVIDKWKPRHGWVRSSRNAKLNMIFEDWVARAERNAKDKT
jgi:hypothetical protein